MRSLILNLILAGMWLLFHQNPNLAQFIIGFATGFILLALFQSVIGSANYVRRGLSFVRFLVVFLREFILANVAVTMTVLFGARKKIHPNFITLDVDGMKPFEILILSYCITLTPGTTSVEIEDDFKTLIVHALDAEHPEKVRDQINSTLRESILEFTR